jgi:hypothetical protein
MPRQQPASQGVFIIKNLRRRRMGVYVPLHDLIDQPREPGIIADPLRQALPHAMFD